MKALVSFFEIHPRFAVEFSLTLSMYIVENLLNAFCVLALAEKHKTPLVTGALLS